MVLVNAFLMNVESSAPKLILAQFLVKGANSFVDFLLVALNPFKFHMFCSFRGLLAGFPLSLHLLYRILRKKSNFYIGLAAVCAAGGETVRS